MVSINGIEFSSLMEVKGKVYLFIELNNSLSIKETKSIISECRQVLSAFDFKLVLDHIPRPRHVES